ncbi:hypothetical protein FB45DRAFT_1122083 [Roridomyces roridus]|uniref:Uncharacterized protein n=1 Tax=Roridomyces roridus TaxID=1738132 RepID=A0AAD7FC46_9AGAR|nr:hypothetical protein FB45DRAFT_1122083 [Roridomyces roridus]
MSNPPQSSNPPADEGTYVPEFYTFAVLTIDAVATVAYLGDPEASAAASKLVCGDYVVYCPGDPQLVNPNAKYRQVCVDFVLPGPLDPSHRPDECFEASMSVPIEPQPSAANTPSGRDPLKMMHNPFPWTGAHIDPFATDMVVDPVVCELDEAEGKRYMRFKMEDEEHRVRLLNEEANRSEGVEDSDAVRQEDPSPESLAEKPSVDSTDSDWEEDEDDTKSVSEKPSVDNDGSDWEDEDDTDLIIRLLRHFLRREADEGRTTVTFSYDLSRVKDLKGPNDYIDEVYRITKIVEESKSRKQAAFAAAAQGESACDDGEAEGDSDSSCCIT